MGEGCTADGFRDTDNGSNTATLVRLLCEVGPDIAEISRRLGQFRESVRYRYKEKIVKNGFSIKATPNYGALGLKRVVARVRMGQPYGEIAQKILAAMSDACYVVGYAGTMPEGEYLVHAAVPLEFGESFEETMEGLREMGIFQSVTFYRCDNFRVTPMRAESFDFEHGEWDFDWSKPLPLSPETADPLGHAREKFDKIDLLIVKELFKDGTRSLADIQKRLLEINGLEVNYKTLVWHYTSHVIPRRLINGYNIEWHGVRYDYGAERKKLRPHGYLFVALTVKDVSEEERMTLMGTLNRVPFLRMESAGRDYFAQLAFPVENTNEALRFLGEVIAPFGPRAQWNALNQNEMLSFTIANRLWDDPNGRWTLDSAEILARFRELLVQLRELGISPD